MGRQEGSDPYGGKQRLMPKIFVSLRYLDVSAILRRPEGPQRWGKPFLTMHHFFPRSCNCGTAGRRSLSQCTPTREILTNQYERILISFFRSSACPLVRKALCPFTRLATTVESFFMFCVCLAQLTDLYLDYAGLP